MSNIQIWTLGIVATTFLLYIIIAIITRASSTKDFFVASKSVSPLANGAATAADWMSAASFISMAGIIAFSGRDGSRYLMGWTGGYVLLALLLAPYLRKFGQFTIPDFVGDRYSSKIARVVAVICALFVSFTYVCGQMRGVGIVFSRFLEVDINVGVAAGMLIVFFYAVLGGMKGITYTQVAQYCILIFAFMVPAIFISFQMTGNPIPQLGFGGIHQQSGVPLLERLNQISTDLGFQKYTSGSLSTVNLFCITAALMFGTAGLPHVIVRFYTVKRVRDARISVFWALLFIAILYTTAPSIAVFARTNLIDTLNESNYQKVPSWFKNWEKTGLVSWIDKNNDGKIQYRAGKAFTESKPVFARDHNNQIKKGKLGQMLLKNTPTKNENELYVNRDIMVLANPEIAKLPNWIIALVAAGGLAAALSTAAGLLLVISTAISHDLIKKTFYPKLSEKKELAFARIGAAGAVLLAGYYGINPPGFVAQVVAFAFGLAASSFFPVIFLGIFSKRTNQYGAIAGMLCGLLFTATYIIYFKFISPDKNSASNWLFGISPEGIGTIGMLINFAITIIISRLTPKPPEKISHLVDFLRRPTS